MTTSNDTILTYEEALEEVHTRFVLNLPDSELLSADRIFFQIEQAWWFYEDLICDLHPAWNLPRFASLKPFSLKLFEYSPLLPDVKEFPAMWAAFIHYKRKISNYGCILMNDDCSKFILCKVWNGKSYTFPSGKINQGEDGNAAAARETYEETGFDPAAKFGITAQWLHQDPSKITWNITLPESDALVFKDDVGKRRTAYVVVGVPSDFPFQPVARKEISDVVWFPVDDFPKSTYAVIPFLGPLKKWIRKNKKTLNRSASSRSSRSNTPQETPDSREKKSSTPNQRGNSRDRVAQADDDIVKAGLAQAGDVSGWSEKEMFLVNEKLTGRKVEYDGNPHVFSEEGFGSTDPHAFRVVGGAFSSGIQSLAPPPDRSKLQPLFHSSKQSADELKPFFSDEGLPPWGELVEGACDNKNIAPRAPDHETTPTMKGDKNHGSSTTGTVNKNLENRFFTDQEINDRSQQVKQQQRISKVEAMRRQCEEDMNSIRQWAAQLPKPIPTRVFGNFRLDIDRIMVDVGRSLQMET